MASTVINGDVISLCTNTLNKVLIAMDLGDGDMFADCFAADGVCHIAINKTTKTGTTELVGLGKALHAKFSKCKHWEGNVCISHSDTVNTVTNRSYWKAMDGGECVSTGIHVDSLQLQADGHWKITNRVITHTWTKPAAAKPAKTAAAAAAAAATAETLPPPAPKDKKKAKKAKAGAKAAAAADAAEADADATPSVAAGDLTAKKEKKRRERHRNRKPAPDGVESTHPAAPKVCRFFKTGTCRNGDTCAFVHENTSAAASNGESESSPPATL